MHITRLPLIVTEKILQEAARTHSNKSYLWKNKLYLLAVCHEWRNIASGIVYRNAFVEGIVKYDSNHEEHPNNVTFSTNIDLITSLDKTHYVREVAVCLDAVKFIVPFVQQIDRLFQFYASSWLGVSSLRLDLYSVISGTDNDSDDDDDADDIIDNNEYGNEVVMQGGKQMYVEELVSTIVLNMPNVKRLILDSDGDLVNLSKTAKSTLFGAYGTNLKHLSSRYSLPQNINSFSRDLTHLEVKINQSSLRLLPQVHARSLQTLILEDVPLNFSWKYFQQNDSSKPGPINFSSLTQLDMQFEYLFERFEYEGGAPRLSQPEDGGSQATKCTVLFPKLENLSISHYSAGAELSFEAAYPRHMKSVLLKSSVVPPNVFIKSGIRSIDKLEVIMINVQAEYTDSFYSLTKHLFSNITLRDSSYLVFSEAGFTLDVGQCKWSNLKSLQLLGQIEYATLRQLICKMPKLESIAVHELAFNAAGAAVNFSLDPSDHALEALSPWETSITSVNVLFLALNSCAEAVKMCIGQLLLCATSLELLDINGGEALDLRSFADRFKPHYAHLRAIEIGG
ncbi:hypothetical protein LPJ66_005957 [Kickxella alabastrina]|uniref:Uncharacterized protein n=1 Tax=Kickxella alabastrina TaxID=61397 RepID=A0ACC1IGU2_9FUNG|nr:hypothetical protein LPJ66_005957 [Kickxella alabastrina]